MTRQQELETDLRRRWEQANGFAAKRSLHVIPFEEWLVKQAIDGDHQADELLGLRQISEEHVPCPYCGLRVPEWDVERPADYCHHDRAYPHPRRP